MLGVCVQETRIEARVKQRYTKVYMVKPHTSRNASGLRKSTWHSWKNAILETVNSLGDKNLSLIAAGIAYFAVLAFFPLMAATVAIAGLLSRPDTVSNVISSISQFVPQDIASLLTIQLQNVSGHHASNLFIVVLGLALALWSISAATSSFMSGLNVAYGVKETRHFVKQKLLSIGMTAGLIAATFVIAPLLFSGGTFLQKIGFAPFVSDVFSVLRWVILCFVALFGLAVLYRFGPNRERPKKWQWLSYGSLIATGLWMLATALFFVYLQGFANFENSYSLFAGLIGLMLWFNLSSFMILLGAEVNGRMER